MLPLNLATQPPAVIMMGVYRAQVKPPVWASWRALKRKAKEKKVLVVSADVYRPAAIAQLERLAADVDVEFFPSSVDQKPVAIATAAIDHARKKFIDVVLVDTAGRLAVDEAMMTEIKDLHAAIQPIETLFVVDAMTGQDAANTAKAFNEALPLTGFIKSFSGVGGVLTCHGIHNTNSVSIG